MHNLFFFIDTEADTDTHVIILFFQNYSNVQMFFSFKLYYITVEKYLHSKCNKYDQVCTKIKYIQF